MTRDMRSCTGSLPMQQWLFLSLVFACFLIFVQSASDAPTGAQVSYKWPDVKYLRAHGFLMWASIGFCMPLGILIVRMMKGALKRGESTRKLQILVNSHICIQVVGVCLSVAGGVVALTKFGKEFPFTHERLGLSLLIAAWSMPIIGFLRPDRGQPVRPFWYGLHWLVGTATVILGFINIYIGMHVYELISSKSLRTWNILFSIQLSVMGLIYLAQDRWGYLQEQGQVSKPIAPQVSNGKNEIQSSATEA